MSFRSLLSRKAGALQPAYVPPAVGGRFRFSVPVLRVRDIAATVAWYRRHLGFSADPFPERAPHEFAIMEQDGVKILVRTDVRRTTQADVRRTTQADHDGWDLYLWVDGLDLRWLEASFLMSGGEIVRPLSPMSASIAELEIRDPDGYVLCIGGPTTAAPTITDA